MRVLLVQALSMEEAVPERVYPIGIVCLAGRLTDRGHTVSLLDMNMAGDPFGALKERLLAFQPELVGLSLRNVDPLGNRTSSLIPHFTVTVRMVAALAGEAWIVAGGTGFSLFPERIMAELPEIDYGFVGEAEDSFPALVSSLENGAGSGRLSSLENVPSPGCSSQGNVPNSDCLSPRESGIEANLPSPGGRGRGRGIPPMAAATSPGCLASQEDRANSGSLSSSENVPNSDCPSPRENGIEANLPSPGGRGRGRGIPPMAAATGSGCLTSLEDVPSSDCFSALASGASSGCLPPQENIDNSDCFSSLENVPSPGCLASQEDRANSGSLSSSENVPNSDCPSPRENGIEANLPSPGGRGGGRGKTSTLRGHQAPGPKLLPPSSRLDLNRYNPPARHLLDPAPYLGINSYVAPIGIETKRGCPYQCAYCVYPGLQGSGLRRRPPSAVVDEMESLNREYSASNFHFTDPVLNIPRGHLEEICREILRRKLKIRWSGFMREDQLDEKNIALFEKAGCECFFFSADGLCQESLDVLKKGLSEADILRAAGLAAASDVISVYHFMVNVPGESEATVAKGMKLLDRIYDLHSRKRNLGTVVLNNIRILPGTAIEKIARAEGVIGPETDLLYPVYYNPKPFDTLRYRLQTLHLQQNIFMWHEVNI